MWGSFSSAALKTARLVRRPISKPWSIESTNVPSCAAVHPSAASAEAKKCTKWQKLLIVASSKHLSGRRNDCRAVWIDNRELNRYMLYG